MASIQILGKIGKNVEVKQVSGSTVAQFSLAENVGFGQNKQTIWYDCSLWGNRAQSNLIDYLNKGREVFIVGEFSQFVSQDGKTYNKVNIWDIKLTSGSGQQQGQQQQGQQQGYQQNTQQGYQRHQPAQQQRHQPAQPKPDLDDDLPF